MRFVISLLIVAATIFSAAKLLNMGKISELTWIYVLSPIWIPVAFLLIISCIQVLIDNIKKKNDDLDKNNNSNG